MPCSKKSVLRLKNNFKEYFFIINSETSKYRIIEKLEKRNRAMFLIS